MKTLRTAAVLVAVGLGAVGLAVLPAVDEAPTSMPGIVVGEDRAAEGADVDGGAVAGAGAAEDPAGEGAAEGPGGDAEDDGILAAQVLPGDVPESGDGTVVALPRPRATEQPVQGVHSDTGVGPMKASPSPEPPPPPAPKPAPAPKPRPAESSGSSNSGSGGSSSSGSSGSSSSGGSKSSGGSTRPPAPSGLCEWDDGEWECDEPDDDDDDDDEDEYDDD